MQLDVFFVAQETTEKHDIKCGSLRLEGSMSLAYVITLDFTYRHLDPDVAGKLEPSFYAQA